MLNQCGCRSLLIIACLGVTTLQGQSTAVSESADGYELPPVAVIGSPEAVFGMPGSAEYIGGARLGNFQIDDVGQALAMTPGVYVRQEDGYGLFPNISLRGVDASRSAKVTLMEDGVLTAPAPYSAPAAYYSPTTGRIAAIEVVKGSAQIQYGPHTTGGAINYLSTPLPMEPFVGRLKLTVGTNEERRAHLVVGGTQHVGDGSMGAMLELYHRETNGFKTIGGSEGYAGSDETGFERTDGIAKLAWVPVRGGAHRFELKVGFSDLRANEAYVGQSFEDFESKPYRRYAASRGDVMKTDQSQYRLTHDWMLSPDWAVTTTAYYQMFHRNWYKLNDIADIDTDGDGMPEGQETTDATSISLGLPSALGGALDGQGLEVLRGERAALLRLRANNRDYRLGGIQTRLRGTIDRDSHRHEVEFGLRYHEDRIRRFQWHDRYAQASDGSWSEPVRSTPGSDGNRRQRADAISAHVNDVIGFGRWTVEPGLRYERIDYSYADYAYTAESGNVATESGRDSLEVWTPGVGATYRITDEWLAFGGVYRGYSAPGPRAYVRSGVAKETSLSTEVGMRLGGRDRLYAEAVVFRTTFDDLIVIDNIGGAGSGSTENVGEVRTQGIEFNLEANLGSWLGTSTRFPFRVSATYTDAQLEGAASSSDAESIFSGGEDGNRVPYIPRWLLGASLGVEEGKWRAYLSGNYVSNVYSNAAEASEGVNPVSGEPDARFGRISSSFVANMSVFYAMRQDLEWFATVNNLFDRTYTASLHPHGPRAGLPREVLTGVTWKF